MNNGYFNNKEAATMFEGKHTNNAEYFRIERVKNPKPTGGKYYHYHDFYELYYLRNGERFYFVKDETYHITSGMLVLIKPYDIHASGKSAHHGYDRHLVNFDSEYIQKIVDMFDDIDFFECFNNNNNVIKLNMQEQHYIESVFKTMEEEQEKNISGSDFLIKTLLAHLLIFLNRKRIDVRNNTIGYTNSTHKTVSEITAYINTNYRENISLESVSEKFFISKYYLSRIFKKNTGFTFVEYLHGVRIKEAKKLLERGNYTIGEIAELVGYTTGTRFGKVFKSITGLSPLSYKKYHRTANGGNEK